MSIKAAEQPALAVVSRVFFALFALDLDSLSHDFDAVRRNRAATPAGSSGSSRAPRRSAACSARRIVSGGASVARVALEDGNGDRSEIELSGRRRTTRRGLTADERRRF